MGNLGMSLVGKKLVERMDSDKKGRLKLLELAKYYQSINKTPLFIKIATGWEFGEDGNWKYEIPDLIIEIDEEKIDDFKYNSAGLKDIFLRHRDWTIDEFENYFNQDYELKENIQRLKNSFLVNYVKDEYKNILPKEIAEIPVFFYSLVGSYEGGYFAKNHICVNTDWVAKEKEDARSVLLHEVQHLIQQYEDFERGSNPSKAGSFEMYIRSGGEWESRVVQARANLSDEQRRKTLFRDTVESRGIRVNELWFNNKKNKDIFNAASNRSQILNIFLILFLDK